MNVTIADGELQNLYLTECGQIIDHVEKILLGADQSGVLGETAEFFRLIHTLKGSSAMMEYTPLVDAAHRLEDVLGYLKNGAPAPEGELLSRLVDAGLSFVSFFRTAFRTISAGGAPTENHNLTVMLVTLAGAFAPVPNGAAASAPQAQTAAEKKEGEIAFHVRLRNCPMPHIRAFLVAKSVASLTSFLATDPAEPDKDPTCGELIRQQGFTIRCVPLSEGAAVQIQKKVLAQTFVTACTPEQPAPAEQNPAGEAQNVTVPQKAISRLALCLGEIASAESALEAYAESLPSTTRRLESLLAALRRTVADADAVASSLAGRDVGSVFRRMQRTVRTMAKDLGKQVRVRFTGDEVQVDGSILELLSDCLIHIVRNAVDHGIELPDVRQMLGKTADGVITMTAVKSESELTVTVSDDGAGVDRRAVLKKAERLGKLTKPASAYTDAEIFEMLLSSGLSTNESVTRYSGRGVGLDTVLKRVRQAGGSASMSSHEGAGTVFTLRIPVTLMVLEGVLARLGGGEVVIPASATGHVIDCRRAELRRQQRDGVTCYGFYGGEYRLLRFPGEAPAEQLPDPAYLILLPPEYGRYCIGAEEVSMTMAYYVKKMPEYVSDVQGQDYIYAACVLCADRRLRCVADAGKLIRLAERGESRERP